MPNNIVELPNMILCSNCVHVYQGAYGLFCGLWREEVEDAMALECPEFEVY